MWPGVTRKVLENIDVKIPASKSAASKTYSLFQAIVPKPVFSDSRTATDRIAFNILRDPSTRRVFFPRLLAYSADAQLTKSELQGVKRKLYDLQHPDKTNTKEADTKKSSGSPREESQIRADAARNAGAQPPSRPISNQAVISNKRQKTETETAAETTPKPATKLADQLQLPSPAHAKSFDAWLGELSGWIKTQRDPHQSNATAGGKVLHQALNFTITHPTPSQVKQQVLQNMKSYITHPKGMSLRDIGLNIALFNDFDRRFQRAGENMLLKVQTESLAEVAYQKARQNAEC